MGTCSSADAKSVGLHPEPTAEVPTATPAPSGEAAASPSKKIFDYQSVLTVLEAENDLMHAISVQTLRGIMVSNDCASVGS